MPTKIKEPGMENTLLTFPVGRLPPHRQELIKETSFDLRSNGKFNICMFACGEHSRSGRWMSTILCIQRDLSGKEALYTRTEE